MADRSGDGGLAWAARGMAACVASVGGLLFAVGRDTLLGGLGWLALGAVAGLWGVGDLVHRLRGRPGRIASYRGPGLAVAALGAVFLGVGLLMLRPTPTAVGIAALIVGGLPLLMQIAAPEAPRSMASGNWWRRPTSLLGAGAGLLVVSLSLLASRSGLGWFTAFASVLWLAGLGLFKTGLSPWMAADPRGGDEAHGHVPVRGWVVLVAAAGTTLIGSAMVWFAARNAHELLLLLGVTLLVAALSAAGLAGVFVPIGPIGVPVVGGLGGLAGLAGLALVWRDLSSPGIAAAIVAVVSSVGVFFVLRGEGILAVVLVGFVLVWALVDRDGQQPDPLPGGDQGILVALGDSYTSGEGAPDFVTGTNQKGRNTCRRAETAYSVLAAAELGLAHLSFACSGATTEDVLRVGQMPGSPAQVAGGQPQVAELAGLGAEARVAVDVVGLSLGGNDLGFSRIIRACLLPGDCSTLEDRLDQELPRIRDDLVAVIETVHQAAPNALIALVPYPVILEEQACGLLLSDDEHAFVRGLIADLNSQVEEAAGSAAASAGIRVAVVDAAVSAFENHQLCSEEPALNWVLFSPPGGSLLNRLNPGGWAHGSMHPNERGHRLTAAAVASFLDTALAEPVADPPVTVDQLVPPGSILVPDGDQGAGVGAVQAYLDGEIEAFAYRLAGRVALAAGMLVLAGMLLATALTHLARHRGWRGYVFPDGMPPTH